MTGIEDSSTKAPLVRNIDAALDALSAESVRSAWNAAADRCDREPPAAITAVANLLESVCKVILDDRRVTWSRRDDLGKLYRAVQAEFDLGPDHQNDPDPTVFLQAIASLVSGAGQLRNRAGDAHGTGRHRVPMSPSLARLVVASGGALAVFLIEEHDRRRPFLGCEVADVPGVDVNHFAVWWPTDIPSNASGVRKTFEVTIAMGGLFSAIKQYGGDGPHQHRGRNYMVFPNTARAAARPAKLGR